MPRSIERTRTPAGDPAWHVYGYADVKALLADPRLGRGHPDPPRAGWYSKVDIAGRPAGGSESEYADHKYWRKAMNKVFSPASLARMAPTVEKIVEDATAEFARKDMPAELNDGYSDPVTSRVMCALLGAPPGDIDLFRSWTEQGANSTNMGLSAAGMKRLLDYAAGMIRQRRDSNGTDILSVLAAAGRDGDEVPHLRRVVKLIAGMLAFGRETPASVIDWAVMLLLTNPKQRELLLEDPSRAGGAMEEALRMFKPPAATDRGLQRYAHTDMEVGGIRIRSGDMVLIDVMKANHDSDVFPDPSAFDITRDPNPHLTFGYGFYMCNFARLGRMEIELALRTLFERFGTLRLAQQPDELRFKDHLRTGGIAQLLVAW